ncbi:MAG: hypothetical protein HYR96_06085 [Deltaproteobacteria bacterium]|nr:hypothetical protein [Deltaproteobacteria bacterium]MBI3293093.1 hypothetical protein [Deltaproteobacteria bacterium]
MNHDNNEQNNQGNNLPLPVPSADLSTIANFRDKASAEQIIRGYIDHVQAEYSYRDKQILLKRGERLEKFSLEQVFTRMLLDLDNMGLRRDKDLLQRVLGAWIDEQKERLLKEHRERLAYDPQASGTQLEKFAAAIIGKPDRLSLAVLKHFIWQVKVKLNGEIPVHHLMPVLVGKSGGGKSVAVEKFLSPIAALVEYPPDIPTLTDERNFRYMWDYYILVLDEMAKAKKADADALKSIITARDLSQRVLRTTGHETRKNRATFIGTTNHQLPDLLTDPTGVRRFWQIDCQDKVDWEAINTLESQTIWKSVDEKSPSPILEVIDEIHLKQEDELRNKEAEELFLEQCVEPLDATVSEREWTDFSEVFSKYKIYCEENKYYPVTAQKFARRLKAKGYSANKDKKRRRYNLQLAKLSGAFPF